MESSIREKFGRDDEEAIAEMTAWAERLTKKADTVVDGDKRFEIEEAVAELRAVLRRVG